MTWFCFAVPLDSRHTKDRHSLPLSIFWAGIIWEGVQQECLPFLCIFSCFCKASPYIQQFPRMSQQCAAQFVMPVGKANSLLEEVKFFQVHFSNLGAGEVPPLTGVYFCPLLPCRLWPHPANLPQLLACGNLPSTVHFNPTHTAFSNHLQVLFSQDIPPPPQDFIFIRKADQIYRGK